jgi:hypothetical protein
MSSDFFSLVDDTDDYSSTTIEYTPGSQDRLDFDSLTQELSNIELNAQSRTALCERYLQTDALTLLECLHNVIMIFTDSRLSYLQDILLQFCRMSCLPLPIRLKAALSLHDVPCDFLEEHESIPIIFDQGKQQSYALQLEICEDAIQRSYEPEFNHTLLFETVTSILCEQSESLHLRALHLVQAVLTKELLEEDYRFRLFVYIARQLSKQKEILMSIAQCVLPTLSHATHLVLVAQYIDPEILNLDYLKSCIRTDTDAAQLCDFFLQIAETKQDNPTFVSLKEFATERLHSIQGVTKNIWLSVQNLHDVSIDIESFVEKMMEFDTTSIALLCMRFPHHEDTLHRMEMDQQLYSSKAITINTLLGKCWTCIQCHPSRTELETRFDQELTDMKDTCTSGHLVRLLNVFSGWMDGVKLDVKLEIQSVVFHRLQRIIEQLPQEQQEQVIQELGSIDSHSEDVAQRHIQSLLYIPIAQLHDELIQDYKSIVDEQKFDEYFRQSLLHFTVEMSSL